MSSMEMVELAYERGMKVVLNPSPCDERLSPVDFSKLSWLLINEVETEQCMERATIASAISVMRADAAPSIPTRDEVDNRKIFTESGKNLRYNAIQEIKRKRGLLYHAKKETGAQSVSSML